VQVVAIFMHGQLQFFDTGGGHGWSEFQFCF